MVEVTEINDDLLRYFGNRQRQREDRRAALLALLTERERGLVREAAVMGFVQGLMHASALHTTKVPADSVILDRTVDGFLSSPESYRTVTGYEQEPDDEEGV